MGKSPAHTKVYRYFIQLKRYTNGDGCGYKIQLTQQSNPHSEK